MVVLVTGADGQLGQALQFIQADYPDLRLVFANSQTGDITDAAKLEALFEAQKPQFCINAAAYTAVDKAEAEPEKAHNINVNGARNVAVSCRNHGVTLLHISTDFVFDGLKTTPYTELDHTNPTGVYGQTKRDGEIAVFASTESAFVIRTSWVYSQFGNNFMKTMLRLASERDKLSIVNDQIGTPTHAVDLARALISIIKSGNQNFGIYNFSNEGQCSWYEFASEIFNLNDVPVNLTAIPTSAYPTPAKRPHYSVLDKSRIKNTFGLEIRDWKTALRN
ncbi:MAG: dTDP-4-dehydrorhamnose reductase [Chitinophagaceae bacterium]|nr:MAG: dTDP-4-dehydrorhamnose reductase [Chitinophagaceae bacterium]